VIAMNLAEPSLPRPRGFVVTALLIGAATALPFGVLWTLGYSLIQWLNPVAAAPYGLAAGVLFGVLFGLAMGAIMYGVTATVPVADPDRFITRLYAALAEMGYEPTGAADRLLFFRPSLKAGLMAGRITVQAGSTTATIVGPKNYVLKLKKKLTIT
jgi:hypothetical protein